MSQIFIETRGKSIDYRFLVKSPSESWWRTYSQWTAFENPTLIIENTSGATQIYLSAIPSKRKDRTQTTIRYTLVIELDRSDSNDDLFLKLISKWLEEVKTAPKNLPKKSEIGDLLDRCFPENMVEELLIKRQNEENPEEMIENLKSGISNFQFSKPKEENTLRYKMWWGGINNQKSNNSWISLVSKLLKEGYGKALLLNLAGENDLKQLLPTDQNNQNIGLLIIENDQEPTEIPIFNRQSDFDKIGRNWPSILTKLSAIKYVVLLIFIALFVVFGRNFFLKTIP
ncbi:hypothetical protein [Brasilonema bromeliae]|uniref:Uncharacterized protein n=1 Tax=Brasilonema bromeliae SPC951 TaxID=385972 RepID=A0ABX1PB67_9CYAN|nr:hypothetical protein [Brasilonema bromeliae]NMG21621.1 hypothetical protein [Brasilonema bromeliae SPC951]